MKRKKLHTATYHCPACFIELEVVAEESLKCDQCGGPLDTGGLDEVWADDDGRGVGRSVARAMSAATAVATVGQNPLRGFVVRRSSRAEGQVAPGSQRP
jgi:hypothetical protein